MTNFYQLPELDPIEAKPIPGLGPVPVTNDEWWDWKGEILLHRATIHQMTNENWKGLEKTRAQEIVRVANDGRYWLSTYAPIFQSAQTIESGEEDDWVDDNSGSGGVLPFVPYVYQLYSWDAQMKAFRTRGPKGDTVYIKARQMGMTNLLCAIFSWAWMTRNNFQGRLMSRKEDLVDETNNPDSIFWKVDLQLRATPNWMLQAFAPGFDWRFHRMVASLTNPGNANHLAGESTNATAGRGGNATAGLLDEYAFMRGGKGIWTATRANIPHRAVCSTVHMKMGTHFYDLVEKAKEPDGPTLIRIPHYLHPEHGEEWLEQERKRDTEAGIQTEILMNFFGDTSDYVYPGAGHKELGHYPYIPFGGDVFVPFDDGWTGYWAFAIIQYVQKEGRFRVIDSYRNSGKPVDFYGSLFRNRMIDGFEYGEHERAIMEQMRVLHNPVFIGDTHGKNMEQVSGMSVIQRLAEKWGIYVNVDFEKRDEKDRQEFLAKILPFMDWNDTPRNDQSLKSLKRYRWKEIDAGDELLSIPKSPIKNHDSHDATMYEFFAGHWESFKYIISGSGKIAYGG